VAAALLGSAVATGGLVGFASGVLGLIVGLPAVAEPVTRVVVAAALLADLGYLLWGRPRPWAVNRQIPVEWSDLFSPATVAMLYGARLGVGPLTILPSWLWWASMVVAAATGPGVSAAAGLTFAAVRVLVMVIVAEWLRHAAPARMARLRRAHPMVAAVVLPVALGALLVA
jgi:hypothetical protein